MTNTPAHEPDLPPSLRFLKGLVITLMITMIGLGQTEPALNPGLVALWAVALAFASASQDIVIDAYRIEAAEPDLQAMMSAA